MTITTVPCCMEFGWGFKNGLGSPIRPWSLMIRTNMRYGIIIRPILVSFCWWIYGILIYPMRNVRRLFNSFNKLDWMGYGNDDHKKRGLLVVDSINHFHWAASGYQATERAIVVKDESSFTRGKTSDCSTLRESVGFLGLIRRSPTCSRRSETCFLHIATFHVPRGNASRYTLSLR
jgi:hypothetical protein